MLFKSPKISDLDGFILRDLDKDDGEGDEEFCVYGALAKALHSNARIVLIEGPSGTGKSRGTVELVHLLCEEIPGVRAAFIRKKRVDATESILQVYEDWVLPKGHPALKGPQRAYRKLYRYPNDSQIHVFGLSDRSGNESGAEKLKSTAWDIIVFEEATEMSMDDAVLAKTRLRSAVVAKPKIFMPFNPSVEQHWIYSLIGKEDVEHYHTIHHDNPRYWREQPGGTVIHPITKKEGVWTPKGLDYIQNNLAHLPEGPMRDRFFLGQRVKPSGIVYPEFDYARNVNPKSFIEEMIESGMNQEEIETYITDNYQITISSDWGQDHPQVQQVWLKHYATNKSRMIKELYRTGMVTDAATKELFEYFGWGYSEDTGGYRLEDPECGFYLPLYNNEGEPTFEAVSDHDLEARMLFQRACGVQPELAYKSKKIGIQTVKLHFRDGNVTFDVSESIGGDDSTQKAKFKPTSTISEVLTYRVNPRTGDPIPIDDDGLSAARYYVTYVYEITDIVLKAKDVANKYASNPSEYQKFETENSALKQLAGYMSVNVRDDRSIFGREDYERQDAYEDDSLGLSVW